MKDKSLQLTFLSLILITVLALSAPLFAAPGVVTVELGASEELFNPNFSPDLLEPLDENGLADPELLLQADSGEQSYVLCQGQVNLLIRAIYSQDTAAYKRLLSHVPQAKVQRLISFCKENYPSLAYGDSGQSLIGVFYSEGSFVDGNTGYLVVDFCPNDGDFTEPRFVTFFFGRFDEKWEITDILWGKPSDGQNRSGVISSAPPTNGRPVPPRPGRKDLPFNPLFLSGLTWAAYQAIKQRKSLRKIISSFWEENKYKLLSDSALKIGNELAQKKTLVQKLGQITLEPKHPFFSKAFKFLDNVSSKVDKLGTIADFAPPIIDGIKNRDWKLAARGCLKAAFSAGGAALGGHIGTKVGLAIGTALGGPIGGAIGAVVGNVAGSWLGSMGGELAYNLADKYVPRLASNAKTVRSFFSKGLNLFNKPFWR